MNNEEFSMLNDNPNVLKLVEGPIQQMYNKIHNKDFVGNTVQIKHYSETFAFGYPYFDFFDVRKARRKYIENEMNWYRSMDRSILGHPGIENNKIWQATASKDGKAEVNSQYGWIIFSQENGSENKSQFEWAKQHLLENINTRQACIYYSRPTIHTESKENGKYDMICTYATQFLVENNKLHMLVSMRSNALFTGFVNDFSWQSWVHSSMLNELLKEGQLIYPGDILWYAGSLHAYEEDYDDIIKIWNRYLELKKEEK